MPVLPGTYSGDPSTSPTDEVRFLVGDTNPSAFDISDAEIQYQFNIVYGLNVVPPPQGNFLPAALSAEAIAAKYKKMVDKAVGDLRISYSGMYKQFQELAVRLRSRAALQGVPFYVGGLSYSRKAANDRDRDLASTAAKVDGMDNGLPVPGFPGNGGGYPDT